MRRPHPAAALYALAVLGFTYGFVFLRVPVLAALAAAALAALGVGFSTLRPDARLSKRLLAMAGFGGLVVLTATAFLPFAPLAPRAERLFLAVGGALAFACVFLVAGGTVETVAGDR